MKHSEHTFKNPKNCLNTAKSFEHPLGVKCGPAVFKKLETFSAILEHVLDSSKFPARERGISCRYINMLMPLCAGRSMGSYSKPWCSWAIRTAADWSAPHTPVTSPVSSSHIMILAQRDLAPVAWLCAACTRINLQKLFRRVGICIGTRLCAEKLAH